MNIKAQTNAPNVITKKAIIVGLILVVVNAYWVGIASELWYAVYTLVSPFSKTPRWNPVNDSGQFHPAAGEEVDTTSKV